MKEPLETHLAYFLKNIKTPEYRRACLKHWTEHYGEKVVAKVIELSERKKSNT